MRLLTKNCRFAASFVYLLSFFALCFSSAQASQNSHLNIKRPPVEQAAEAISAELIDQQTDRAVLKVRNHTPFIVLVYDSGVRIGWIKPFRDISFSGLKAGKHKIYAHSQYGSNSWGPEQLIVPTNWNIEPPSEEAADDMNIALASRIFNTNKASLLACDRIAEKRGESVRGLRVEFEIDVNAAGKGTVIIKGDEIGPKLSSCYRAVISQWQYPNTGSSYSLNIIHMPTGT